MEQLYIVVSIVAGACVVLMALRFILRAVDKRELQYSADYCRSIEEKGVVFNAKYTQYLAEYEQLGNRLTYPLRDNFYDLASEIKNQITDVNYNMLRMLPRDQKVVTSYRTTWRCYEQDIRRIIDPKV